MDSKSILAISRDRSLQLTRVLILERAGYSVSSARTDQDVIRVLDSAAAFSLALMCHSVPERSRLALTAMMRKRHPKVPILMLYNGYDPTGAQVDGSLYSMGAPSALVDMVEFLTSPKIDSAAKEFQAILDEIKEEMARPHVVKSARGWV